ncbi:MAG: hypothetical protein ACOCY7_00265 [Halodesulfurarchaeum sp.]
MSLDALNDDVEAAYSDLKDVNVALDRESRMELAMLATVLDTEDVSSLVQRAIHLLFQSTVDTGKLDFHLRSTYDVTYDEYLSGMTYEEMTGGIDFPQQDTDERRYQF